MGKINACLSAGHLAIVCNQGACENQQPKKEFASRALFHLIRPSRENGRPKTSCGQDLAACAVAVPLRPC